jgi:hypothetical protein
MSEIIAVETLTLSEVSNMFKRSLEKAYPMAKGAIASKMKKLIRAKISSFRWTQSYEIFKGAKINFYCERIPKQTQPIVSIGMTHRTTKGMILVALDTSNGGINASNTPRPKWDNWVNIYTAHCCERYAERIIKLEQPSFLLGSNGIMFSDVAGVARVTKREKEGIEEVEYQFADGQFYGYRDPINKIVLFKNVYSNDMLKGARLIFNEEWKETVEQLNELFRWKAK